MGRGRVHRDAGLLGEDRDRWGAFNYAVPNGSWPRKRPTVTFYPNRLAGLDSAVPDTFVTVNPVREPRPDLVVSDRAILHPILDAGTGDRIRRLEALQGTRRLWFAGAYLRSPAVHESALSSGVDAARALLRREGAVGVAPAFRAFPYGEAAAGG
ncbi:MAG: hypothetical protein AAGM22_31205 [Acidobacteriota bacterium]